MSIPTPEPSQDKMQKRRAITIAVVFLIAIIVNLILSLSQGFQTGAWQHFLRAGFVVLFGIATITATIWIRRGRAEDGVWLIIRFLLLTLIGTSLLLGGFGLILALIELALAGGIASFIFPKERRNRSYITTVVAAFITLISDLLPLDYRIPAPPSMRVGLPVLAVIVTIAIAAFAIQKFQDYRMQVKLLAIFIGITSIVMIIVGTFSVTNLSTILTSQEETNHVRETASKSASVNSFLAGASTDVLFLSKSPSSS